LALQCTVMSVARHSLVTGELGSFWMPIFDAKEFGGESPSIETHGEEHSLCAHIISSRERFAAAFHLAAKPCSGVG
jgi:hypothetical protein